MNWTLTIKFLERKEFEHRCNSLEDVAEWIAQFNSAAILSITIERIT